MWVYKKVQRILEIGHIGQNASETCRCSFENFEQFASYNQSKQMLASKSPLPVWKINQKLWEGVYRLFLNQDRRQERVFQHILDIGRL